ncbi:hypothetical protein [Vibrio alginolyticus]|uniref:hypothetical protein n=1 Tax=Vibrio alginolyticus TaxID=663 RepID=UPI003D7DF723
MKKLTLFELNNKIESEKRLSIQFKGSEFKEANDKIYMIKLPKQLERHKGSLDFDKKLKSALKNLEAIAGQEIVFTNGEPIELEQTESGSIESSVVNGLIKFSASSGKIRNLPVNSMFRLKVDELLIKEIEETKALNNRLFDELKNDLDYALDLILQFETKNKGLISNYYAVVKQGKKFVKSSDAVNLSESTIQSLVLHINKKYKKAFRTSELPTFTHFKEAFMYGVSGQHIKPLHDVQEVIEQFKAMRCKTIMGRPAAEYMTKALYQELDGLDVLIYDYTNPRISAYDSNKILVANSINNFFNKINDDLAQYISNANARRDLIELYSKILCDYYIKGVQHDLDVIIASNMREGKH